MFNPNNRTIYWDPRSALLTQSGGHQTPVLGLAHELVHAEFYDQHPKVSNFLNAYRVPVFEGSLEEFRAIFLNEFRLTAVLGEDFRLTHSGIPYKVSGPMSTAVRCYANYP